jgi:3alpha(or 20beta)-hydroxysteroid dehydrogenase
MPNAPALRERPAPRDRPSDGRPRGTVALVTGAGRGIGESIARVLAELDFTVVVTDAVARRAEKVASSMAGATSAQLDVTDEGAWKEAVASTVRRHGGVDVLVNNAGIGFAASLDRTSRAQWDTVLATNLTGPFLGCRTVVPAMKRAGSGVIVNVSSIDAIRGREGLHAYAASKAGLRGLSRSLAVSAGRWRSSWRGAASRLGAPRTPTRSRTSSRSSRRLGRATSPAPRSSSTVP